MTQSLFDTEDDDDHGVSAEINVENVDKLMAREIDRLSLRDRNALFEEIHGVSNMAIEETPELVEYSLRSFEIELEKINPDSRIAYDSIANQFLNNAARRIVTSRAFRLRFLRCVFFNPSEAALRMVNFFELLYALYGREHVLSFDETMDFFIDGKGDQIAFRTGLLQLLPFRDRSGRKILIMVLDALEIEGKTRLKIFLYMIFVAGQDAETQRNGVVMLFWPGCKEFRLPTSSHMNLVSRSLRGMPTRFASFHFCFSDSPFFQMTRILLTLTLSRGKGVTRVKVHIGERIELQYQLMGYGIPGTLIPTTGTGTLKTKFFVQWFKARKLLERFCKMRDPELYLKVECPGVRDVIFRSAGRSCMLNPGNVAFRGVFEKYHSEHVHAGQTEKKNLVWKIVGEIESRKGRFLVWDKRGWWVPLEDRTEIRNKVAISLRGYNKQREADANRQSFKSSTHAFTRQNGGKRMKRMSDGEDSDDSRNFCQGCLK